MEKKKWFVSPYMIYFFLVIKVLAYYHLIEVNIFSNILVLETVGILALLFFHFGKCEWKYKHIIFFVFYTFFSVIMFADTMYYNYYNQTVSIQQVYQVSNVAKVPSSFLATLLPLSFFIIWDIPFAWHYFKVYAEKWENAGEKKGNKNLRRVANIGCILWIFFLAVNPWDWVGVKKVNSVEFFANHIRDIVDVTTNALYVELWEEKEVLEVVAGAQAEVTTTPEEEKLQGIAKGKNLIVIQLEAYQNFVIGAEYNGQVITPNINALLEKDTIYFDNYYSVIGKGNTADAEFASLNSLYPVIDGESYRLYTKNTYDGLPWKLKDRGYETYGFHGNEGAFWNRQEAYPYQGIDHFYSVEKMDDGDRIGLGVSDISMFNQMVDIVKQETKPFFAFAVTLTSHHPYDLPEEERQLSILPEDEDSKFANYLQSVHYTDRAVGQLIAGLKQEGLYENTVIALYGDHHGLNVTMDDNDIYVGRFLGKEYGYEEMLKVPFLVHTPNSGKTKTISTLGCQVDFFPTIASLMGIEIQQPYIIGQDLLTADHGFAAFTAYLFDGSFACDDVMFQISREGIFEGSKAWNRKTLEEVDSTKYEEQYKRALELKEASRQVMEQNLIADYVQHEVSVPEEQADTTCMPDEAIE